MRVPWYICLIVSVVAFGVTYWLGVSKYDFVTPPEGYIAPSEELVVTEREPQDEKDDEKVISQTEDSIVIVEDAPIPETIPIVEDSHPSDYLDQKEEGVLGYIALAETLIAQQYPDHSLVAWERVLDSAEPNSEQVKRAYDILKLHKVISKDEVTGVAISITLHASVPADLYDKMEKILANSAALIELGAGYAVSVSHEVSITAVKKGSQRPAVSVWFSGKNESPRAHFRTKSSKELGMEEKVNSQIFNIVTPFIRHHTDLTPLVDFHNEVNAQETLQFLITRHSWRQFALLLYKDLGEIE